jgi:hypothetical protein
VTASCTIESGNLRQVGFETADGAGAHHGAAIVGHGPQHSLELGRLVRQHAHPDALGELGHDQIGNGTLELSVDLARRQRRGAGSEIEVDRRKIGKSHAQRAEQTVRVLHHAARARAERNPLPAQIGK